MASARLLFILFHSYMSLFLLLTHRCCYSAQLADVPASNSVDDDMTYTYDQMINSLTHDPNDVKYDILRGRCNVDMPFTASLSMSAAPASPSSSLSPALPSDDPSLRRLPSCGEMSYICSSFSIRAMCDMITNMNAPTCSCSADCGNYTSCCADHEILEEEMTHLAEAARVNECRRPFHGSRDAFMIRSFCSVDWSARSDSGYLIKDACEEEDRLSVRERLGSIINGSTYERDFLSEVWVTSARSAITYKNIFCLVCNFDFYEDTSDEDLIFWPNSVKCVTPVTDTVVSDPKYGCILDHQVNGIKISDAGYEVVHKSLIPCYAEDDGIISDCPRSFSYDLDQRMIKLKCETIFSPVREIMGKNSIYYRNEWCAKCHGIAPENIQCLDGYLPRRSPLSSHHQKQANVVFDFVYSNISVTAERRKGARSERQCKPNEIFDPFIAACRTFLCHQHEDCRLVSAGVAPELSFCLKVLVIIISWVRVFHLS